MFGSIIANSMPISKTDNMIQFILQSAFYYNICIGYRQHWTCREVKLEREREMEREGIAMTIGMVTLVLAICCAYISIMDICSLHGIQAFYVSSVECVYIYKMHLKLNEIVPTASTHAHTSRICCASMICM